MNVLKVGGEYTKSEVKEILLGIYHDLGIQGKPSASDITGYLTCEEKTIRINGKKQQCSGLSHIHGRKSPCFPESPM